MLKERNKIMNIITKKIAGFARIFSVAILAVVVAFSSTANTFAWGGTNLNQTAGGTDKVCVRDLAASTAENCDVYINPAASYTLFNRFIDRPTDAADPSSPRIDERNFVQICEIDPNTDNCTNNYVDNINVTAGKQYQVYVMYHNNGATLSNGDQNPLYSSHNAKMKTIVPDNLEANTETQISSTISWDTPGQPGKTSAVWDEAFVKSNSKVDLRYVSGSAKIHMNKLDTSNNITGVVEKVMPTNLFGEDGTFIGHYDTTAQEINLDGITYGCAKYSGWVTYRFEVKSVPCPTNPDLSIDDPKCNPPCEWNEDLPADDPKCVAPPSSGSGLTPTATVSLVLFLGLATVMISSMFARKQKKDSRK